MQIEFKDDYNETTYYFGTVTEPKSTSNNNSDFVVEVIYFSNQGNYTISNIEWVDEPKEKIKAEERITEMVLEWHEERLLLGKKKGEIKWNLHTQKQKS